MTGTSGPQSSFIAHPQLPASQDLGKAVLDTGSPARGLLKEAEAKRLAHLPQPGNLEFVKGGVQPASEGKI